MLLMFYVETGAGVGGVSTCVAVVGEVDGVGLDGMGLDVGVGITCDWVG